MTLVEPLRAEHKGNLSFGLMSIGEALLALSAEAIREVVPGHAVYARIPTSAPGIMGAVALRGAIIPIFDLRIALGIAPSPLGSHVILIMRSRGRVLGLVAEKICGMATVARSELIANDIETDDSAPRLATHVFQCDQGIASLLEADRIAALPGLQTVAERTMKADDLSKCAPILLFSFGPWNFGIDAAFVAATAPCSAIERNALTGGFCLGVVDHHGYDLPVVDLGAALGMGTAVRRSEASVVVVRFSDTAMLGFVIDEVHDIAQIPEDRILPIPSLGLRQTTFFRGVCTDASARENLILDVGRLKADARLSALASLRKPKLVVQQGSAASSGYAASKQRAEKSERFLTFRAGTDRASLITQVIEFLAFPALFAPLDDAGTGLIGFFSHKNRVTPMIVLGSLFGHRASIDPAQSRVLMAEHEGIVVGFVVDSLYSIEPAQWTSRAVDEAEDLDRRDAMIMVGLGEDRRLVHCVDLVREIRTLTRRGVPELAMFPSSETSFQERVA